jgi:hypothetical protein
MVDAQMTEAPISGPKPEIQNSKSLIVSALIILVSVAYKLFLLALNAVPFNGDEAIVALMARHILRGERPVFFYGQAYLGATDAWLVAASFSILAKMPRSAWLHLVVCRGEATTHSLGATENEWGARAAMLDGTKTMLTLINGDVSGYTETLLLGNILL